MAYSVGVGLTNECNLRCPHCYRPDAVINRLSAQEIQRVCEAIPVRSMNLGVGENGLHPDYRAILDYLTRQGIVTSITSNGLSTEVLTDAELTRFRSVEFSLDFPTEREHDAFRGQGNWQTVMRASERCANIGVPVTVTAVMMRLNYDKLPALARVAASVGANLRVNVYQPSKTDHFSVSYEQFWEGFTQLLESTRLVTTTEPVVAAVLGLEGFAAPG
jgi:MoaA/NifB/PqqE/SkfB family radical SAM enzyme